RLDPVTSAILPFNPSSMRSSLFAHVVTGFRLRSIRVTVAAAGGRMTIKNKAYIAGIFEHPTRHAPDKTVAQLHAEVAPGALKDAGLTRDDVDGYFCAGDAPGPGPATMAEYMNLKLRHVDCTELGGTSYVALAAHAAEAIALGKCDVALIT